MPATKILVIGATGLIGRPITEQLVAEGFQVRALVPDKRRAAALLPDGCELAVGDLRDEHSILAGLSAVDADYLSFSNKMSTNRPERDADIDGTMTAVNCMSEPACRDFCAFHRWASSSLRKSFCAAWNYRKRS